MKIRISSGTRPIETSRWVFKPGCVTTTVRYPPSYAIVSGWFGRDTYREFPIREGTFKRLCKQHRGRATGLVRNPLRLHNYVTINL